MKIELRCKTKMCKMSSSFLFLPIFRDLKEFPLQVCLMESMTLLITATHLTMIICLMITILGPMLMNEMMAIIEMRRRLRLWSC